MFDTAESIVDQEKKPIGKLCKSCRIVVPVNANYCPSCGGKQFECSEEVEKILALGVKGINIGLAIILLDHFGSFDNILKCNENDLLRVNGIGSKRAIAIRKAINSLGK
jgi:ERCC4-type nuclease